MQLMKQHLKRNSMALVLVILLSPLFHTVAPLFHSDRFSLLDCKDRVLEGFVFQTAVVTSKIQCTDLCAQIESCVSLNIEEIEKQRFRCELNAHRFKKECDQLSSRNNSFFYQKANLDPLGETCKELKQRYPTIQTGIYWIQPNVSVEPFQAYCDMATAGGGWTLVYSYRFVDIGINLAGRISVWPTWNLDSDTPKSTIVPLSDLEEGAMEFNLWKEIGEEFLITSSVTNWYQCAPSTTSGTPGSMTQWIAGDLNCSVAKVEVPEELCDDVVPTQLFLYSAGPLLGVGAPGNTAVLYDGLSNNNYPTHDPCGTNNFGPEGTRSADPRGAIYVR